MQIDAGALQQRHDALGRAGAQQRHALGETTDVVGMEAIDVLVRTDALEQQRGVQMLGQRQLNQDAVDGGVVVELIDQRQQLFLAGFGGKIVGLRMKPDFLAVLALVRHINLGRRVHAHQNHCQARNPQPLIAALGNPRGNLLANVGCDRFTVDQFCGHDAWLTIGKDLKRSGILARRGDAAKAGRCGACNSFI